MPESLDYEPEEMHLHDDSIKPAGKYDHEDSYGGDHKYTLIGRSWKGDGEIGGENPIHHWMLKHDDTGVVHLHSRGGNTKDGYFIPQLTAKHPDSETSAVDFYKQILDSGKVKGIQSSNQHTDGGKSIWRRMSEDPELDVTHHDTETGKQIKLHPANDWEKNYDQNRKTHFRVRFKD